MLAHPVVTAVSDRRRRSEIYATICVPPYNVRQSERRESAVMRPIRNLSNVWR